LSISSGEICVLDISLGWLIWCCAGAAQAIELPPFRQ
jgi:hypothetical protein